MDELISKRTAIDALTEYGNGRAVYISVEEAVRRIEQLPPAQPKPCNYVNACNELAMNNTSSTYGYLQILKEFEKYGYILVDTMENIR